MAKQRNSRSKSKPPAAAVVTKPEPVVTDVMTVATNTKNVASEMTVASEPTNTMTMAKATPSHDDIARRAYELWLHGGGQMGTHLEDWLRAERELRTA